ncbi:probable rRNA maturation factor [Entomortierella parvispora]|uniref:Probable rRNA maturation factor n=1 Tax=Entomortierella parvispora TaxID=205924 RepID=A0A9P3HJU9_9FUNG|nr:probable rRNA maturation factor [Entomortierella parvispora]
MILLKNSQLAVKVSNRKVIQQVQLLLSAAGYRDWDIGVCLTGNTKVKQLNSQYRGKDKATDILSFPFAEAIKPGKLPVPRSEDDKNLGDIFISMKYVNNWCEANKVDIHERLPVLYAHGICHLLGYDHNEDHDYAVMKRKENRILKKMRDWESLLEDKTKDSSKTP